MSGDIGNRLSCAVVLSLAYIHLRWFGFRRTLYVARKVTGWRVHESTIDSLRVANALVRAVEEVAVVFPGRALCLEQSLTLFTMLRWAGIPANLRMGAVALPFTAHAWVEVGGEPINAEVEFLSAFQVFPELPE
ncbi:MAG: lasso peptide biosynthesis B2 protein [Gemmatimonadaceae bacterium]